MSSTLVLPPSCLLCLLRLRRVAVIGGHRVIIFGFLPQNLKTVAVAVAFSIAWREPEVEGGVQDHAPGVLAAFRAGLYRCFTKRPDALFELADALVCKPERVHMLAELSLEPECRRGHGAVYDAVSCGTSASRGCGGRWRACRCRPGPMAGSG